jgi:predicted AlkP superfamily pyrophosphatase or phosphodiesterase
MHRLAVLLPLLLSGCYAYPPPALTPATQPAPGGTGYVAEPAQGATVEQRAPVTILVSIDGLGANRLGQGVTPQLDALATAGVSGSMRPSFPSNTFPNHVTLVTGVRPDRHGVVDQRMRDPAKPGVTFRNSDPLTNRDPFWWKDVAPIWLDAEAAGIRTGVMYWTGADVPINGKRPSIWWPFDPNVTAEQRTDTVIDWVRRPAGTRPQLLMLYFDDVDRASHNLGYGSPEELAAIRRVDGQVGRLVAALRDIGQPANLVIVSDHGMAPVPASQLRPRSEIVDDAIMESLSEGPTLSIYPRPGQEAAVAARLKSPPPHLTCWAKADIPARYRYRDNSRIPPFFCMADVGWSWPENPRGFTKGEHGYDPDAPEVAATFIGAGPAFRSGRRIGKFDNVAVYPLLRTLLGLPVKPGIDGDPRTLAPALRR